MSETAPPNDRPSQANAAATARTASQPAPEAASPAHPDPAHPGAAPQPDTETQAEARATGLAGLRRVTWWAIGVAVVLFLYFIVADRTTPFAGDARVQAFILRVAPEVNGRVLSVAVSDNQIVEAGDTLFELDRTPFELAVAQAQARLDQAGQSVGASTASIDSAQARLEQARAHEINVRAQSARIIELVDRGIYAEARRDDAVSAMEQSEAAVEAAEAELEEAKEALGPQGADNPQIQEALAALDDARYDLSRTQLISPAQGVVTNLQLTVGQTVNPGHPAMTFISADDVWVLASLRENSLHVVEAGQRAELVLDIFPGRVYPAVVRSKGWGIAGDRVDATTGLPTSSSPSSWLTDPQRFPVLLEFDPENRPPQGIRYGSRVSVIIYSDESRIMRTIAWARIRLIAWLTYIS